MYEPNVGYLTKTVMLPCCLNNNKNVSGIHDLKRLSNSEVIYEIYPYIYMLLSNVLISVNNYNLFNLV